MLDVVGFLRRRERPRRGALGRRWGLGSEASCRFGFELAKLDRGGDGALFAEGFEDDARALLKDGEDDGGYVGTSKAVR